MAEFLQFTGFCALVLTLTFAAGDACGYFRRGREEESITKWAEFKNEQDLKRIDFLMDHAKPGSEDEEELERLAIRVERYEQEKYGIDR